MNADEAFFIDNQIVYTNYTKEKKFILLNTKNIKKDTILLTFLNRKNFFRERPVVYANFLTTTLLDKNKAWNFSPEIVSKQNLKNISILFFLINIMWFAFIQKLSPKQFVEFFDILGFFNIKDDKIKIISRIDSVKIAYIFIISFLLVEIHFFLVQESILSIIDFIKIFIKYSFIIFFKLFFLKIVSWIYKFTIHEIQFFVSLKNFFLVSTIVLFFLLIANLNSEGAYFYGTLNNFFILISILNFIAQYRILKFYTSVGDFYIFSYLCIVELVPITLTYLINHLSV